MKFPEIWIEIFNGLKRFIDLKKIFDFIYLDSLYDSLYTFGSFGNKIIII